MKRIDRIYNYISTNSKNFTKKDLLDLKGFSTKEISNALGILRNNVSKELNILWKEKKVIKIKNRPVIYFDRKSFENILSTKIPEDVSIIHDINLFSKKINENSYKECPFNYLIGAESSLKNQIEQAKAAIIYPPSGLHTLVIGNTGVGKSLFVKTMYEYAKYIDKLSNDSPFIIFNCADYANNPQLLLSHIFGHIKGSYTGADKETDGVITKADKGILFLDEIHRLPPEGQEMIFYFMDTGTYNKLGETQRKHKAQVLIIGATTEDPSSSLLDTFIRRIPITIRIPDFNERPLDDKIELLQFLIKKESERIKKTINISSNSIKALIGSTSYGNVGQLKSNIQLACAKAFFYSINKKNASVDITLDILPDNIKRGLSIFSNFYKNIDTLNTFSNTLISDRNKNFLENYSYNSSLKNNNIEKYVGIVVIAYGKSTASSMVNLAKKLFNVHNISAVNIYLEYDKSYIINSIIKKVQEVNQSKGVLLIIDTNSLSNLTNIIYNRTNIITKSINMLFTPLILEAVKKCTLSHYDLDFLYSYLLNYCEKYTSAMLKNSKSITNN